jgi:predicted phage baseplate assembly protein
MPLPAPNLDDRRFQDLVDDAKRMVQQRCPEWTDHNVHDPGVTLIETFAWMTDQLLYRLNRVPERHYLRFLDLLGVRLYPPTAAQVGLTFWLSAPQPGPIAIPAGTEVTTARTDGEEVVGFVTTDELVIPPVTVERVRSQIAEGPIAEGPIPEDDAVGGEATGGVTRDHGRSLAAGEEFRCFDEVPKAGDLLLVGLSGAAPSCAVTLRLDCRIEGVGVDPEDPPLTWEAWTEDGWRACEIDHDETGGMNRAGDIVVHVPAGHAVSVVDGQRAGWLRARVLTPEEGQPAYSDSPRITRIEAFTIGGTVAAVNAEDVEGEIVGLSELVPGQRFTLAHRPVLPADGPVVLEVDGGDGWEPWTEVEDFAASGPDDPHFLLDHAAGEVCLGPAVRDPDGSLVQFGRVPPAGSPLRIRRYRTGGGERGNVGAGTVDRLRRPIPFVDRVGNRYAATGGRDGEAVENAKVRGPLQLRTRNRAVTLEDYAHLAEEAALDAARVHAVAAGEGAEPGGVRVLVVPHVTDVEGRLAFEQLVPRDDMLVRIAGRLDECRTIGARVVVEPPTYQGITVVARVRARPAAEPAALQRACIQALFEYFHPVRGGPDRDGWPFGRPVHVGEVYAVLQRLPGVELIEDARLFPADPITGERGTATQRLELDPHALVFSHDHQVRVG